jgi:hypothetical protein
MGWEMVKLQHRRFTGFAGLHKILPQRGHRLGLGGCQFK